MDEVAPGVFAFPLFQPRFSAALLDELSRLEGAGIPLRRWPPPRARPRSACHPRVRYRTRQAGDAVGACAHTARRSRVSVRLHAVSPPRD
eukprot:6128803-Prymnesium_polylepis.1